MKYHHAAAMQSSLTLFIFVCILGRAEGLAPLGMPSTLTFIDTTIPLLVTSSMFDITLRYLYLNGNVVVSQVSPILTPIPLRPISAIGSKRHGLHRSRVRAPRHHARTRTRRRLARTGGIQPSAARNEVGEVRARSGWDWLGLHTGVEDCWSFWGTFQPWYFH